MRHYSSGPTLPVEVYKPIVKYLAEDRRSLQNISLVCRYLRTIAQSILFSSVVFTGADEEINQALSTLQSKHSQTLSHLRTLSLIFRSPNMWLEGEDGPGPRLLELIIKQAKDLRAVQIGPFYLHQYATEHEKDLVFVPSEFDDVDFNLSDSPESIATLISEAFPKLEKIVLEEVCSVSAEDVQLWRGVKTLQVPSAALIIRGLSDSSSSCGTPEDGSHSLPAPTALTVSLDEDLYDIYHKPREWHGCSISFDRIKDLRMEIREEDEHRLFNTIMQACHHNLESLRLSVRRESRDQALDLSGLSSLKSLYFIIYDLVNPVRALSQVLNWLNVKDLACLEELCLYIHVDKELRGDWLLQIIAKGQERKQCKTFWRMINEKLGEIFEAKNITHVSLKLPPSGNLSWEKILEYIHEVMPSTKHQNFHLNDTAPGSQAIFQSLFTRADEQALRAIKRKIADECRESLLREDNDSETSF